MKISYNFIIAILILTTTLSSLRILVLHNRLENIYEEHSGLHSDLRLYLHSLTNNSINIRNVEISTITGDTILVNNSEIPIFIYHFHTNECCTCIDQHISELLEISKNTTNFDILVTTNKENVNYLKKIAKIKQDTKLNFGFLVTSEINQSFFLKIKKGGKMTNTYYPDNNNYKSTKRYLKNIVKN